MAKTIKWEKIPGPTVEDKITSSYAEMATASTLREYFDARRAVLVLRHEGNVGQAQLEQCKADALDLIMPEWDDYDLEELGHMVMKEEAGDDDA